MLSSKPVAIVTGGGSGIGLGIAEYLVRSGWNVAIFDFNGQAAEEVAQRHQESTIHVKGNAALYADQVKVFIDSWQKWKRVDLVVANVGFGDRMDFSKPAEELEDGAPAQPDLLTIDVSLVSSIWSSYLALHFFRKNACKGGKIVFTSSLAGLYPTTNMLLYGAAKHGVVSLARGLGKKYSGGEDSIESYALCPGLVPTPLISEELRDAVPQHVLTPVSTIVQALERILKGDFINGAAVECSGTEIQARPPQEYLNAAAEYIAEARAAAEWNGTPL
ncbi:hypothetical protein FGADI_4347 [Fusarium gaditjirri]|uniref:NAD(P)-binding protein n=1 Tax=Fusarium gaditjirri TaxID=282569 RepID=A0A8H4WZK2_9HYPO|nr:hypothetical protein FGADI_4347 [Fusarium gaditjirri]